MPADYDAIVIGACPGGEVAASQLHARGLRVALVERELVGGECAYWACVPSKTLLRPPEVSAEAVRVAGIDRPARHWAAVAAYRDFMIRNLDDTKEVEGYRDEGVDVCKGEGRIVGPGAVDVAGQTLSTERIIVATGSDPAIPTIEGLAETGFWTNRQATTLSELPDSVIVLGGGPVGVELGQFLARFEVKVTLIQAGDRLLPREEPAVAELIATALRADGIDLRLGSSAESVTRLDGAYRVRLS